MTDPPADPGERPLPPELDPRGPRVRRRWRSGRTGSRNTGPGSAGPGSAGPGRVGSRGRRTARVLSWIAVTLSLVLFTTGVLYAAYRHYGGRIQSVPGLAELQDDQGGARTENFLVVGSDSADGLTDAQLREVGANRSQRSGVRTDTIMLVHVPADGREVRVVSFPRDAYVEIPGHGKNKINGAYESGERDRPHGGPALLIQTVQNLTGLHVDHYVQVSLYAFFQITNAVGGVEVCLSQPAKEERANIDLPAGEQTLQGRDALAFVRQRYGLPGGDLGRIRRQQYFLGALTRRVLSAGVLLNPARLNGVLNAVGDNLLVDPGTSRDDLLDLAYRMRGVSAGKVIFQTLPVQGDARVDLPGQPRASVVLLDEAALPGFFANLDDQTAAAGPALTVPPSSVAVRVENGAGRPGLAREVGAALTRVGFRVQGPGTAARSDVPDTLVRYGADRAESARTVAAALPGSVLTADPGLPATGLVVTVGASYRGVKMVKVVQPGAPPAPPRTAADAGCIA